MHFELPESLDTAVLQTVAYGDVFDFPVTLSEIHRYLIGCPASIDEVSEVLANSLLRTRRLEVREGFVYLPGREHLVAVRKRRAAYARPLWRQAVRCGRWITHLPFVSMVGLTGALTSSNVENGADIDFLVITRPGYLWLCRAFIVLLTRVVAPFDIQICPNYLLTSDALELAEKDLFTAQELARLVPVSGLDTYYQFRALNRWTDAYLPNASQAPDLKYLYKPHYKPLQAIGETMLGLPFGRRLEHWEMQRKIDRLSRRAVSRTEIQFSADRCKGHFERHGARTLLALMSRIEALQQERL